MKVRGAPKVEPPPLQFVRRRRVKRRLNDVIEQPPNVPKVRRRSKHPPPPRRPLPPPPSQPPHPNPHRPPLPPIPLLPLPTKVHHHTHSTKSPTETPYYPSVGLFLISQFRRPICYFIGLNGKNCYGGCQNGKSHSTILNGTSRTFGRRVSANNVSRHRYGVKSRSNRRQSTNITNSDERSRLRSQKRWCRLL